MRDVKGIVDAVLAAPPSVHPDAPNEVWRTDRDCYELLVERTPAGARTFETGCGVSTALFASCGAHHVCVVPNQAEVDALLAWCAHRDVPADRLTFRVGSSQEILPTLSLDHDLDVILIDGSHVFPLPVIDWYYTANHLRLGGLIVIDDVQLAAPALVAGYLQASPLMRTVRRTHKWAAYELREAPPGFRWEAAKPGVSLVPRGRLERLGHRADALLARLRRRAGD